MDAVCHLCMHYRELLWGYRGECAEIPRRIGGDGIRVSVVWNGACDYYTPDWDAVRAQELIMEVAE